MQNQPVSAGLTSRYSREGADGLGSMTVVVFKTFVNRAATDAQDFRGAGIARLGHDVT